MHIQTDEIRARLDLRELAVKLGIRPRRRSNRSGTYQRFHCPSPLHPKGDASGDLSIAKGHFKCHSANCGCSGDAFDLVALVWQDDRDARFREIAEWLAQETGLDTGLPALLRPRPARRATARPQAALPPRGALVPEKRIEILARVQAAAEAAPLTPEAIGWCEARGLDPEGVAEAGARDWSAAWDAIRPILAEYTRGELEDAGLCRKDGAKTKWCPPLWGGPARRKFPRCLAVPVRNASGDVIAFRFRLYRPKPGGPKELTTYGSVGPDGFALGAESLGGAHTLVVCEGVPDYLAAREAADLPEGHALWATCAVSSLPEQLAVLLARRPSIEAVELLAHHDRDKTSGRPIPLARVPAWKNLAAARRGALSRVTLRVWRVEGGDDLGDLHARGELAPRLAALTSDGAPWPARDEEFASIEVEDEAPGAPRLPRAHALPCPVPGAEAPPLPLGEARAELARIIGDAVRRGGRHAVIAPPGVGKSYVAIDEALSIWERGGRVKFVLPTNELAAETKKAFLERAAERWSDPETRAELARGVELAPKRTKHTCVRMPEIAAARRAARDGSIELCQRCDLHPSQQADGAPSECAFFKRMRGFGRGRIQISTHHLELLTNPEGPRDAASFDWDAIARASRSGGPCAPWVRQTAGGRAVGARPDLAGAALDLGTGPAVLDDEEGAEALTDEQKARAVAWLAARAGLEVGAERGDVLAAYGEVDERLWDLVIIDESPLGAVRCEVSATLDDLNLWRHGADLEIASDEAWREISDALASETPLGSAELARSLGRAIVGARRGGGEVERALLEDALEADGDARLSILLSAPEALALDAIAQGLGKGFAGARVEGGRLTMGHVRRFDLDQARATLALDATAHPSSLRAIFGPIEIHRLEVERPRAMEVVQVAWGASKNLARAEGGLKAARDAARLEAVRREFDGGPGTAWMLHRTWEGTIPAGDELRASYYGASDARGVNRWKDKERIIAGAHHVPRAQLTAVAEELRAMAGEPGSDLAPWLEAARWELVTAPMIQACWRIRPLSATDVAPKLVVLLDTRILPGLEPDRIVDADELCAAHGLGWGKHGAGHEIARYLEAAGGTLVPSFGAANFERTTTIGDPQKEREGEHRSFVSAFGRTCRAVLEHWGSWEEAGAALGLRVTRIRSSASGEDRVALSEGPLDWGAVCARAEARGLAWVEHEGERAHLGALWYLDAFPKAAPCEARMTRARLAALCGVSERTVRRRLAARGSDLGRRRARLRGVPRRAPGRAGPGRADRGAVAGNARLDAARPGALGRGPRARARAHAGRARGVVPRGRAVDRRAPP